MPVNQKNEPGGGAIIHVCEKCNYPEVSCKCASTGEPQLSAEIEEKFEQMWTEGTGLHDRAKHFLATALEEQSKTREEEIKQAVRMANQLERTRVLDLLDKAELEKWFDMPDTTENWKTWKKIRNTINREDV